MVVFIAPPLIYADLFYYNTEKTFKSHEILAPCMYYIFLYNIHYFKCKVFTVVFTAPPLIC